MSKNSSSVPSLYIGTYNFLSLPVAGDFNGCYLSLLFGVQILRGNIGIHFSLLTKTKILTSLSVIPIISIVITHGLIVVIVIDFNAMAINLSYLKLSIVSR